MTLFTKTQLKHYAAYERVRQSGQYNMWDPHARLAAGLTKEDYVFVMENFTALRDAYSVNATVD